MKEQVLFEYEVVTDFASLPIQEKELIARAVKASTDAYAPYSQFHVGAAVLMENGEIIAGNNQENAAYPSGMCAERVALFASSAQYPGQKMIKMAIYAQSQVFDLKTPVSPCGACRQVIAEYEQKQAQEIEILLIQTNQQKVFRLSSGKSLLPLLFFEKNLQKKS